MAQTLRVCAIIPQKCADCLNILSHGKAASREILARLGRHANMFCYGINEREMTDADQFTYDFSVIKLFVSLGGFKDSY